MVYDLINETPEVLPHFKGGEGEFIAAIHFDGLNKILRGTLPPGATIGRHTHRGRRRHALSAQAGRLHLLSKGTRAQPDEYR